MKKILILRGLPASGKSTFCRELLQKESNWKRVNKDTLRECMDYSKWSPENETFINNIQKFIITASLKKGYNVVCDNTNLSSKAYKEIYDIAKEIGDIEVEEKIFEEDLLTCLSRDAFRTASVGKDVITNMYNKYLKKGYPKPKKEYFPPIKNDFIQAEQDKSLKHAIISDLDGTLAIFNGSRSPYNPENCDLVDDPNIPVVKTIELFYNNGYKILFVSGREDKYRDQTIRFIEKYLPGIEFELFMRKTADMRKDSIIKEEIYREHIQNKYFVEFVLDDRVSVVFKWRELGLTCFQVAPGNF